MESKALPIAEVKAAGGKGEFEALVSVFGNIDSVGDRVHKGAFEKAVREQAPPPVVWSHQWGIPPIGETIDWAEKAGGLWVKGRLFVEDDDDHPVARQVYTAMKSRNGRPPALRQFSFAYDVEESEETFEKGKRVRELKSLFPVGEVGPCLAGINDQTQMLAAPKAQQLSFLPGQEAPYFWVSPGAIATTGATTGTFWFPKAVSAPDDVPGNPDVPSDEPGPDPQPSEPPASPASPAPPPEQEAKAEPIKLAWRFPPLHAAHTQ